MKGGIQSGKLNQRISFTKKFYINQKPLFFNKATSALNNKNDKEVK